MLEIINETIVFICGEHRSGENKITSKKANKQVIKEHSQYKNLLIESKVKEIA